MKYDNYEDTLRSFPHWLDKNPYSNFSKVIRVLNRQYLDKYHKVKCLEFAERLIKPVTIHKEQENLYEYSIISEVMLPNLMTVNFYVNPVVDDDEKILSYEKCFTKEYKDDGYNDHYIFQYDGDSRNHWINNETVYIDDIDYDDYVLSRNIITLDDYEYDSEQITKTVDNDRVILYSDVESDYSIIWDFDTYKTFTFNIIDSYQIITAYLWSGETLKEIYDIGREQGRCTDTQFIITYEDDTYKIYENDVIVDSLFIDNCTSNNNKSNGYSLVNGNYHFENDGLVLESEYSATDDIYRANLRLDGSNVYTVPFEVSFDLVNDGNDLFRCYFYNTNFNGSAIGSGTLWTNPSGQTTKVRFVVTEDGITRYINNTPTTLNLNQDVADKVGVRFGYWQPTQSNIKIKNYKVYKVEEKERPLTDEDNTNIYENDVMGDSIESEDIIDKITFKIQDEVIYEPTKIEKPIDYPIIPVDNFILEVITYDDYRWLKGFPENDNTDLYRIYKETQSYTKYLTFEIKKQNIKKIQIFKDNELIFEEDFFIINENGSIIYNDYKPSQVVSNPNTDVMVADPDKNDYTLRVLLTPEDYDEEGNIKSNFDLYVTTYDLNNPNCPQYDKINHKRYNGNDKTNYDCFTHDYSLDMIGVYWNIPRLEFQSANYENKCDKLNNNYYSQTYPPYNDRLTEDDYHYQNRMQTYIQKYNIELFPVLELWKNYQVWGNLRSRKDILSTQGKSYLTEYPYYEDTTITVESKNLLNIIEGESNNITINNHSWYETILADNLYVVPETEYHLNCTIETQEPISSNERLTYHIYYYDKRNQCINEEVYNPKMVETLANTYKLDKTFKTREDVVTVDVVLEYDNPFSFKEAMMRRLSIADKDAMYMATKNDYHSCVYDLTVDYTDVPTNINFSNTRAFEKLLQRSLPLSHKGYLNIGYTEKTEEMGLCDGFGNLELVNIFDETNDHSEQENVDFRIPITYFCKEEATYHLRVEFTNTSKEENYITTLIYFNDGEETIEVKKLIQSHPYSAILSYNFTTPKNTESICLRFICNENFNYKGLRLSRKEKIQLEELWET